MKIEQFEDINLAHYSYAILSKGEIAIIDPARNPEPYINFAKNNNAKITAIIETHPHADFVSSHLELSRKTGATIYVSKLVGAEYPHQTFDDGDSLLLGEISLKALNTPGHSPDSISIVLFDENGKESVVFTGDTLFIGDCGRPDLRENAGAITATRTELAKQMYHSLHTKLMTLPDDVEVYPAHGAGSLCGKGLSEKNRSTIGAEKISNWSLQDLSQSEFISELLADQPFIPKYFGYDVMLNKKGANDFQKSIDNVEKREPITCKKCAASLNEDLVVIDTRPQDQFKKSHLKNSINLMDDKKFETWLGSIIDPGEKFYLAAQSEEKLNELISRIAKIGYEDMIELAFVVEFGHEQMNTFSGEELKKDTDSFTIVDIRNHSEVKGEKIFRNSIHIPLYELRERANEIPLNNPIVVHCAGGYRSAAGSSILKLKLKEAAEVFDLSEDIKEFRK